MLFQIYESRRRNEHKQKQKWATNYSTISYMYARTKLRQSSTCAISSNTTKRIPLNDVVTYSALHTRHLVSDAAYASISLSRSHRLFPPVLVCPPSSHCGIENNFRIRKHRDWISVWLQEMQRTIKLHKIECFDGELRTVDFFSLLLFFFGLFPVQNESATNTRIEGKKNWAPEKIETAYLITECIRLSNYIFMS